MKEKIYILAAIETIINKKTTTDLGNYYLEYFLDIGNYTTSFSDNFDVSLIIGVKIRNKKTNKIEWANIYYKILEKNTFINDVNKEELLKEILLSSKENQINLILKPETAILKKPYATSDFVEPNEFTKELTISNSEEFPVTKLGGPIPKQIKQEINELFKLKINEIKSEIDISKKL